MAKDSKQPQGVSGPEGVIELGVVGLKQSGGIIREEFHRNLAGRLAAKVYREMEANDAIVGAVLSAIELLARQVVWEVVAKTDAPEDEEAATFIQECLDDMNQPWTATVSEILSFLVYGWSYHEIVYKIRRGPEQLDGQFRSEFTDGKFGWRKFPIRAQETLWKWEFDEEGGLRGMVQRVTHYVAGRYVAPPFIPIEKALLFRTTSKKGNPEGMSLLRRAYRSWFFKRRIEEYEAIGVERDIAGLPVIYAPSKIMGSDATTNEKALFASIKDLVTKLRNDEQAGVVMPGDRDPNSGEPLYKLELLSTGGRRQFMTGQIIERHSRHIAMTAMADFILLGHEAVGSFALADSKTDLFGVALGAFLDEITTVITRHAIPRLLRLNGMKGNASLIHGDIETVDLGELGEFMNNLARAGLSVFDKGTEDWVRQQAGMPPMPEEDDGSDVHRTGGRLTGPNAPGGEEPEEPDDE